MKPASLTSSRQLSLAVACLAAVVQLLLPRLGMGATLHVPDDYPTIALAADAAQSGDVILVSAIQAYVNDNATIRSGVTVRGVPLQEPPHPFPSLRSSTLTLADGPDSTRIEGLAFNEADDFEHQIVAFSPNVVISGCEFVAPWPLYFSSIRLWSGGSVSNSKFYASTVETTAISLRQGTLAVEWCLFFDPTYAVAVLNENQALPALVQIRNNTIIDSNLRVKLRPGGTIEVVNNIFFQGGIITCEGGSADGIRYNDFFRDLGTACGLGVGNIDADPMFCSGLPPDFTVDASSPCVGSGENGATMGARGVGCGVTSVAGNDQAPRPMAVLSVEPNPVRSVATFTIEGSAQNQQLEIYSASGRLVDVLKLVGGKALWNAGADLPRGAYFARTVGENTAQPIKFVVIR